MTGRSYGIDRYWLSRKLRDMRDSLQQLEPPTRDRLIGWGLGLGFALVAVLSLYVLIFLD
ncbi:MAG: hypothetical protein ACE5I7_17385 [Candidatus Binatia bacterium]